MQRLSVFSGGWTLEAAEAVCAGEDIGPEAVLDLLAGLVDKSLVILTTSETGEGRYRMLETIRQYARDRLLEAGGGEAVGDRHLSYFRKLSEEVEPQLIGAWQVGWMDQLDKEMDNLRLALERSLDSHLEEGLRLASSLKLFWNIRSHGQEGGKWFDRLLSREAEERGNIPLSVYVHSTSYIL